GSQYDLKDSPGSHPAAPLSVHHAQGFYPYGQYPYGDPSRAKTATRETTSTLKAWLQEHQKNPRLKKENKVTWGRSAEDRDGRIFSSDNEDEHGKNGSDDEEEEEEIDLETVDIERPEEQRAGEPGSGKGERGVGLSVREQASTESSRTLSAEAGDKLAAERSPSIQECQGAPQIKPKIWSLAETATAPDSSHKTTPPAAFAQQAALASAGHPALLPGHGIYTCQIGKLHNWANAALINANSILNMRSLLGGAPPGHLPLHGAVPAPVAAAGAGTSGSEDDSDVESSESFSPKRDGMLFL
ncbi:hypothetical protein XENOCAPTIV_020147, partial [Xenoophorus captivus]